MEWHAFHPADLQHLMLQKSQEHFAPLLSDTEYGETLCAAGPAITVVDDGEVLACGGLVHLWEGRAQVWSLISRNAGRRFVRIFRIMQDFLAEHPVTRVEATVDAGFTQGLRMIEMLGFSHEGLMKSYQNGKDAHLYALVRGRRMH